VKKYFFLACVLTLLVGGLAASQKRRVPQPPAKDQPVTPSPTPTPPPTNSGTSTELAKKSANSESLIQITLKTSRQQITAGSGFGIVADIENKSTQSVFLRPKYLTMTAPPELDANSVMWWALVPPQQAETTNYEEVIHLGPGAKTTAFWTGNGPSQTVVSWPHRVLNAVTSNYDQITFPPGKYTIRVVCSYWTDWNSAQLKSSDYSTATAEIEEIVAAPQWVIILGAIIGGLIAYLLLPNARLHPNQIDPSGFFTAILLSSIITILLARLSETQFLIRVTINDFWGAIAIGFIASGSGTAILQKYFPRGEAPAKKPLAKWIKHRKTKRRRLAQLKNTK
jgi:hypothetical protein